MRRFIFFAICSFIFITGINATGRTNNSVAFIQAQGKTKEAKPFEKRTQTFKIDKESSSAFIWICLIIDAKVVDIQQDMEGNTYVTVEYTVSCTWWEPIKNW